MHLEAQSRSDSFFRVSFIPPLQIEWHGKRNMHVAELVGGMWPRVYRHRSARLSKKSKAQLQHVPFH
jgi:hypothetical protein